MEDIDANLINLIDDNRFKDALFSFNSKDWYKAHDYFEDLWHETAEPERFVLQGLLQISVAQLHLERGNKKGATILFGEGLGRLRIFGIPDLGLDIKRLCNDVEDRLKSLQQDLEPDDSSIPVIRKKSY